jgi:hypothetical protein
MTGHQDDEWYRDLGEYITNGCTVSIKETLNLEQCRCPNMDGSLKNQIELNL